MSLLFNKAERGNPADPGAPKLWYPVLKSTGLVREKEGARRVADETTLNPREAEFAVSQLFRVVTDYLLNGKTVQPGEPGTFRLTVHSEGAATEAEVKATQIKNMNIRFAASETLKDALKKATFAAVESLSK
jgi:predicted histone-like DNA-binding protein